MNITICAKKLSFRFPAILLLAIAPAFVSRVQAANEMTMMLNGQPAAVGDYSPADIKDLILDNGLLKITFGHDYRNDISATSIIKNGTELAHNLHGTVPRDTDGGRTFYHDYNASQGYMHTRLVKIVKNTPDLVHFALIDTNSPYLEDHYVMLKGESGIHPYVIIKGQFGGEMRTMYRFDMSILDWTWTPERVGQQKSYEFLQAISTIGNMGDETWRLPDGSVYSKYDWCLVLFRSADVGAFRPRLRRVFHAGQHRGLCRRAVAPGTGRASGRAHFELHRRRPFQRRRLRRRAQRRKNLRPVVCLYQCRSDDQCHPHRRLEGRGGRAKKMAVSMGR